jgi:hypothetical protein
VAAERPGEYARPTVAGAHTVACCVVALAGFTAAVPAARAQLPVPGPPPSEEPAPQPGQPAPEPSPPPPRIAAGVTAGGVELGGLTVEEAAAKLKSKLRRRLRRHLVVRVGGRRFGLRMRRVRLKLDAARTARRALKAHPAPGEELAVRLALRHSRRAVRRFVRRVARRVNRRPRNATLRITLRRMILRGGRSGRRLDRKRTARRINFVLELSSLRRRVRARLLRPRPAVKKKHLRGAYPSVITIHRRRFTLRLFRRLRYDRSYSVAVGQPAYPTPSGFFHIQSKQVNPVWTAPNSPWAGELGGQSFAGGSPNNPLKARWMGVTGGVGIHGTGEDWSIGTAASHGCIRMHVSDVIELFNRTRLGSPVLIR